MFTKKNTIALFLIALLPLFANAQCAMCRAALETEESGVPAEAVNDGIMYLMAFPYILLIVVGWAVYKVVNKKKQKKNE
jgi:heme/copper-type cytochrome/quinol oxidase subunit 2